jgi:hypothetical protein
VLRAIDLVLRVVYVALAPAFLALFAVMFPITGTLVGAGLATLVALIGGDRWHAFVDGMPFLGRILGGMSRLGEFYREHPPKPLIYYVLYPVLLPVLLFMRIPRKEFLLYRKLNVIALVVVIATGALDYFRHWRPELTFGMFISAMIVGFILQLLVTFMLVMPIVTTLLGLRVRGHTKGLVAVTIVVALSAAFGIVGAHKMHGGLQMSTWMRISLRTQAGFVEAHRCIKERGDARGCGRENHAFVALVQALDEVYIWLRDHPGDTDTALDRGRDKIADYYKPDEAAAFQLYADEGVYMLYVRYGKRDRIWIARDAKQLLLDPTKLPPGALKALDIKP